MMNTTGIVPVFLIIALICLISPAVATEGGEGLADLKVSALSPTSAVQPGSSFSVDVTVVNEGSGTAGSFSLQGWLFAVSNYQYSIPLQRVSVDGLSPGSSVTRTMTTSIPGNAPSGSYDLKVAADNSNYADSGSVAESNENNNEKWLRNVGAGQSAPAASPVPTTAPSTPQEFSTGNIYGVTNAPRVPVTVTFSTPVTIISIENYHWNNAQGKPPGLVGLQGSDGTQYGPWQASGSPGQGGVPDAYWTVKPNAVIPAGTYTVTDSDPSTWATNEQSGYKGMTRIFYEPAGGAVPTQTPGSAIASPATPSASSGGTIDLYVTSVTGPSRARPGDLIDVSAKVGNYGTLDGPISDIVVLISGEPGEFVLGRSQTSQQVVAGREGNLKRQVTIPADAPGGVYTLIIQVDPERKNTDINPANNQASGMPSVITIEGAAPVKTQAPTPTATLTTTPTGIPAGYPDLFINEVQAPSSVLPGATIEVSAVVGNKGTADAPVVSIGMTLTSSSDASLQYPLGSSQTTQAIEAGIAGTMARQVTIPVDIPPGSYIINLLLDQQNISGDTNTADNQAISGLITVEGSFPSPEPTVISTPLPTPEITSTPIPATAAPTPEPKLGALWTADVFSGNAPLTVQFYDASPGHNDGTITAWNWDFGDGSTSKETDPVHTFTGAGNYTVTMTISAGDVTDSKTGYIDVSEVVKADFIADVTEGDPPLTVQFTDLSNGSPDSYEWNFGGQQRSTDQNPVHTFNFAGLYTIRLDVWGKGGSDSQTRTDYITVRPRVDFNAEPLEGNASLKVRFTPNASYSTDKGQPTFLWDFGDGSTSGELFPEHTYTRAGVYTVRLTITGREGTGTAEKEDYITVRPVAHYVPDMAMGWAPHTVRFSDWSTGEPETYLWEFQDGETSTEQSPSHTYTVAGSYVPHLTVTRGSLSDTLTMVGACASPGCVGSGAIIVMPVADFSASLTTGPAPLEVSFEDLSKGSPETYTWIFGDGTENSTEQNPTHIFEKPGSYIVTQVVATGDLRHTKTLDITVLEEKVTITATAGTGGSITPSGQTTLTKGSDQTFRITPDSGFEIADVVVDGVPAGQVSTYTFPKVIDDHTIAVTFSLIPSQTPAPTSVPTTVPTAAPTVTVTPAPTSAPTTVPTAAPTAVPTGTATPVPTSAPTTVPTAAPTTVPTATVTPAPTSPPGDDFATMEQQIIDLINAERAKRGLTPYSRDSSLDGVAKYHSTTGATKGWKGSGPCTKGTWSGSCTHMDWDGRIPIDRANLLGYPVPETALDGGCTMVNVGENCFRGKGYSPADLPKIAVDAWMKSKGHRNAILDSPPQDNGDSTCGCNGKRVSCKFTKIGIGVAQSPSGEYFVTTNFV